MIDPETMADIDSVDGTLRLITEARDEERRRIARFIQDRLQVDRELHCAARAIAELARRVRDGDF